MWFYKYWKLIVEKNSNQKSYSALSDSLSYFGFLQISDRFYEEFKRHNYVTPTSYLALILTFKSLLKGKKNEIINMKTRYEMGLGKLEFASNQVIHFLANLYHFESILKWKHMLPIRNHSNNIWHFRVVVLNIKSMAAH